MSLPPFPIFLSPSGLSFYYLFDTLFNPILLFFFSLYHHQRGNKSLSFSTWSLISTQIYDFVLLSLVWWYFTIWISPARINHVEKERIALDNVLNQRQKGEYFVSFLSSFLFSFLSFSFPRLYPEKQTVTAQSLLYFFWFTLSAYC